MSYLGFEPSIVARSDWFVVSVDGNKSILKPTSQAFLQHLMFRQAMEKNVGLMLGVRFVTVFGRRSKAVMRFSVRKRRAREVYGRICSRTREAQRVTEIPVSP